MHLKVTICTTVLAVAIVSLFLIWKRRSRTKNIGTVKKLIIYPIKSLPGIEVPSLKAMKYGVRYRGWIDRGFMLLDVNTNYIITLRQKASLNFLKISFKDFPHGDELWVESPEQEILKIKYDFDLNPENMNEIKVFENSIWGGPTIKCVDCGEEAAAWFQNYLQNKNCRLVRHFSHFPLRPSYEVKSREQERNVDEPIAFQDANAVHVINNGSVNEFNTKFTGETSVTYRNFRPNIVVDTEPFIEDYWRELRINNVLLRIQKKRDRCTVPGLNPDTSDRQSEVLEALKKHRSPKTKEDIVAYGKSTIFGINCCVKEPGTITTDDCVIVT